MAQVIAEMKCLYKLNILGISESGWTRSGKMKTDTGETILYSGREDDLHHEGVPIIMTLHIFWPKTISNKDLLKRC